jgi:hypothetical protein
MGKPAKIFIPLFIGLIILVLVFKSYNYENSFTTQKFLRETALKGVIEGVAESRKLEIKINELKPWISIGGSSLKLRENQEEPKEYFTIGDSIFKNSNSDTFHIKRDTILYEWIIDSE